MRLSRIKLAGFKSFVDPTTIYLPSNLVGVVGPNGCGKSNVIDAVRWVMGESSAKHLRGDSMEDVIFNGSSARKPVGTAAIELFFDNADGSIGGQYAKYAEISLKRLVSRDGTSHYFLNNTRCRRKDITNLFLGTGLGPRSYAIIEQGMVSRLVEGKPDDMRTYIEEAAGISKYKERRRETENRIQHTRENLARLNDLRDEVAKQIRHLQRQAQTAEKYRGLKEQERTLEAQLLALRLREIDRTLEQRRLALLHKQTEMEAVVAEQRQTEAAIETARSQHVEATDAFNAAQARYYAVQSEISRLEQAIAHTRENRERQRRDLVQAQAALAEVQRQNEHDLRLLADLDARLADLVPQLAGARDSEEQAACRLRDAERALEDWQRRWHELNLQGREQEQVCQVEQTRIGHLQSDQVRLQRQVAAYSAEHGAILLAGFEEQLAQSGRQHQAARQQVDALTVTLGELAGNITGQRAAEQQLSDEIEMQRGQLESCRGQLQTLESIQDAALGNNEESVAGWLAQSGLEHSPRLVQGLVVEPLWSRAAETVLGDFLQAVCVDDPDHWIESLPEAHLALVSSSAMLPADGSNTGRLVSRVANSGALAGQLASVWLANDLADALRRRASLEPGESVITPDGVWLGSGWLRISRGQRYAGLIAREQEIRTLQETLQTSEQAIAGLLSRRDEARLDLASLEEQRAQSQTAYNEASRELLQAAGTRNALQQDLERARSRRESLTASMEQLHAECSSVEQAIAGSQERRATAESRLQEVELVRSELQREQDNVQERCELARVETDGMRQSAARLMLEHESTRTARESARAALERIDGQHRQLTERIAGLEEQLAESERPLANYQQELEGHLAQEIEVERELTTRRAELEAVEGAVRVDEGKRSALERQVSAQREVAEQLRMDVRESEVRRENIADRFTHTGMDLLEIQAQLAEDVYAEEWDTQLGRLKASIDRLGPINLAAIDEFNEQSERKKYLDAQTEDLSSALATLEHAIRKIDRETRTRFQETFDSINAGMQRIFPRLFGGGHAYLSLEGDEVLTAGVTVMARPPGKRNSNIHLLSGGEKALTAVALIFAIFELNPAPFCLLDEVDAPLDETNVGRFCEIVREMSQSVQFLVITHNKTTMEMMSQLTGVTMSEPGVSRLVTVDIEEAAKLVAS